MKYFPKVRGERVFLSPMSPDDAELYTEWLNDLETTRYLVQSGFSLPLAREREAIDRLSREQNFAIVETATGRLIGNCGIMEESATHRSAEVGIFLGVKDMRGKGYGTEAFRLLCDYAFNVLGMHSLMLHTYAYNERAIASYRKVGFKEVGRLREAHFYGGRFHDIVIMDILAADFGPSVLPGPVEP